MEKYYGDYKNVSDNYLRQCFYWAFRKGLKYPVYQIHCTDSTNNIKEDKFVLMITGNENHLNLDHYYEDNRIVAIIKNYPAMKNYADPELGQAYKIKINESGRGLYEVETEDDRTLNIPLGFCNDFVPYTFKERESLGGFIGQWTNFREAFIKNIEKLYTNEGKNVPFKFALYNGFGPFVQKNESLNTLDYSYHLSNFDISFCFSGQSPETFRLIESAMAGCCIIETGLPNVWYYKNMPSILLNPDTIIPSIEFAIENKAYFQRKISTWYVETVTPIQVGKRIENHIRRFK